MADVSVKMGVSGISQFKQGMTDAQASVKTLDAALKANEKQFKATGDAESHMAAQTNLLNAKLQAQKNIVKNAEQALKQMEANGVKTTGKAYQDMQRKLIEAQSAMLDTQMAMDSLGSKATETSEKTDKMTQSLGGISKKISLDQVITSVNAITTGLENAAKKAVQLGQDLWNTVMDSARWADDTATMAQMYGIDLDTFQRMQKLVTNGLDTTVDSMLTAQDKLTKGVGKGSKEVMETLQELGLAFSSGKDAAAQLITEDNVELFWKAGQAIMEMDDAFDKEAAAQQLFGRSWKELVPLFTKYHSMEEYNAALEDVNVVSEQSVEDLAALNDKMGELTGNFDTLKNEVIGTLAPALTGAADALNGLLERVLEYLRTPEGQEMLEKLSAAVTGLFEDLSKIDPQQVVEGFVGVFDKIIGGLEWVLEHKDGIIKALEGIIIGWGALKLGGGALQMLNLINGLKGLTGGGTGANVPTQTGGGPSMAPAAGGGFWATLKAGIVEAAPAMLTEAAVVAVAVTPAVIAQVENENKWKDEQNQRLAAAEEANLFKELIRSGALAVGPKMNGNGTYQTGLFGFLDMNPTSAPGEWLKGLSSMQNQQRAELFNAIHTYSPYTNGNFTGELLREYWENPNSETFNQEMINSMVENITDAMVKYETEKPELPVEIVPEEGTIEEMLAQIGVLDIPAKLIVTSIGTGNGGGGTGGMVGALDKWFNIPHHANGLWSVPFDGYTAVLHKDERIVPAREVAASRNYNSNLYVESMYMNNGTDAAGLAAAMTAAQRRTMRGYGS